MPIQLTTPYVHNPGGGEAPVTYTMAQIVKVDARPVSDALTICVAYCNPGGDPNVNHGLIMGPTGPPLVFRDIAEERGVGVNPATGEYEEGVVREAVTDLADLKAANMNRPEYSTLSLYDANGASLQQWLVDQGYYPGTIL